MAKYLVQHRRGTAAQWAANDTIIPGEGEIVIEIDEVNSLHKLKIGDGIHTYAELAYLMAGDEIVTQVLTKVNPRVITVTLEKTWEGAEGKYSQALTLDGITAHSRLDLQPDVNMLAEFKQLGLVFVTENNSGVITVYSVGNMPAKPYTMQATIIETECNGNTVIGATVGSPAIQADWTQTDSTKADFIKNKPEIIELSTDLKTSGKAADAKLTGDAINAMLGSVGTNFNETIIGLSIDGNVLTYIKGDGTEHTLIIEDENTEYSLGTDTETGLTKLYATTGSAEDGTMTQKAIKTELDKKVGVSMNDAQNMLIFTV